MKNKDYNWESAGSLTPELEGTPHSGAHKKRRVQEDKLEVFPKNVVTPDDNIPLEEVMSKTDAQRLHRGLNVPDLNTTL